MSTFRRLLFFVPFFCLLSLTGLALAQETSAARMQKLLERVVSQDGYSVSATGSWESGLKFSDPLKGGTSDFDMTLRVPEGMSDADALRSWNTIKSRLSKEIKAEFGPDAEAILKRTNVYPPDQLMPHQTITNEREAARRLRELGSVPKLDPDLGAELTPTQWREAAEGLYGEGGKRFRQAYDFQSGRTYQKVLTPEGESVVLKAVNPGPFSGTWLELTPEGRSGLITQLNHKTAQLLEQSDYRAAVKNVGRMLEERKALMGELDMDLGADSFLQDLLSKHQGAKSVNLTAAEAGELRRRIVRMEVENQFMRGQARNPGLIKKLLLDPKWRQRIDEVVGGALDTASTGLKYAGPVVQGMLVALDAVQMRDALATGNNEQAIKSIYQAGLSGLGTGPGVLLALTDLTMELSKELGYGLVNKNIDELDFLSGISRDDIGSNQATLMDPREVVQRWPSENQIATVVYNRVLEQYPGDTQVQKDQRKLWTERLLAYWKRVRQGLESRYQKLYDLAAGQPYTLVLSGADVTSARAFSVQAPEGTKSASVKASVLAGLLPPEQIKAQVEETVAFHPLVLGPINSGKAELRLTYRWFVDGNLVAETPQPEYIFQNLRGGNHILEAAIRYSYTPVDLTRALAFYPSPVASALLQVKAEKTPLVVTVAASATEVAYGEKVTVTAAVNPPAEGLDIRWWLDGKELPKSNGKLSISGELKQKPGPHIFRVAVKHKQDQEGSGQAEVAVVVKQEPLQLTLSASESLPQKPVRVTATASGGVPPYLFRFTAEGVFTKEQGPAESKTAWLDVAATPEPKNVVVEVRDGLGNVAGSTQSVQLAGAMVDVVVAAQHKGQRVLIEAVKVKAVVDGGPERVGYTDSKGHLSLPIPSGQKVALRFWKENYYLREKVRDIQNGLAEARVLLQPAGTLKIQVVNSSTGRPIPGAVVVFDGESHRVDGTGNLGLTLPAEEQCLLSIKAGGYLPREAKGTVAFAQVKSYVCKLSPEAVPSQTNPPTAPPAQTAAVGGKWDGTWRWRSTVHHRAPANFEVKGGVVRISHEGTGSNNGASLEGKVTYRFEMIGQVTDSGRSFVGQYRVVEVTQFTSYLKGPPGESAGTVTRITDGKLQGQIKYTPNGLLMEGPCTTQESVTYVYPGLPDKKETSTNTYTWKAEQLKR